MYNARFSVVALPKRVPDLSRRDADKPSLGFVNPSALQMVYLNDSTFIENLFSTGTVGLGTV